MKAIDGNLSARVLALFDYDADAGLFRRRVTRGGRQAGTIAGYVNSSGVVDIQIDGEIYAAHRLIWLLHHGEWPPILRHINGDKTDNRICNLRLPKTTAAERAPIRPGRGRGWRGEAAHGRRD